MAKLYFYYSTMNAGKSTLLLQSAHNYRERGMRALILTPNIDSRGGRDRVSSRIGLSAPAVVFGTNDDLLSIVTAEHEMTETACVMVDEAQFLRRKQVIQLSDVVDRLKVPVLCYGLRTDFRGELFAGSEQLLAWADELIEVKTICHTGSKATMVVRIDPDGRVVREGQQVEVGGNERYVSVSRAEFKRLMAGGKLNPEQAPLPLPIPSANPAR